MIKKYKVKNDFGDSINHELINMSTGRAVIVYKAYEYSAFSGKWEPRFWIVSNGDKTIAAGSFSKCYSIGMKYVQGLL